MAIVPRNTPAQVQAILGDHYDCSKPPAFLTPFLRRAAAITDRVATCASTKGMQLTPEELELIECSLAAHFYTRADRITQSEGAGGASSTYQGQTGMYLESTHYGQDALNLDYSGCLTA